MDNFRQRMIELCKSYGMPWMSMDTSAVVMAVLYMHGNNESMVYSSAFVQDCEYIQERFNLCGGEAPDADFVVLVNKYIKEMEDFEKSESKKKSKKKKIVPKWVERLFKQRYNIELIN